MKHKIRNLNLLAFAFCVAATWYMPRCAVAQTFRLNSWKYLTDISLDLSQLATGNLYEGERFGLGFVITTPLKYNIERPRDKQNSLQFTVYGAYGLEDEQWKGGGSVALLLPYNRLRSIGCAVSHDVERAANRQLATYSFLSLINQSSYIASRYVGVNRLSLGINRYLVGSWDLALHLRLSREDYRFNHRGMIYPRFGDPTMPYQHYTEGQFTARQRRGFTLQTRIGEAASRTMESRLYASVIAQYAKSLKLSNRRADRVSLFAQAGYATDNAPYSRLFDLGGSAGSTLYFRNSIVSVRPNAFVANRYAMISVNYLWGKPLWDASFSQPRPFVQLSGMWGSLAGTDADGVRHYSLLLEKDRAPLNAETLEREQILPLEAPDKGLMEVVVGIERLLRWSNLELGAACAYQYAPASARYATPDEINLTLKVILNFAIDYAD